MWVTGVANGSKHTHRCVFHRTLGDTSELAELGPVARGVAVMFFKSEHKEEKRRKGYSLNNA